MDARFLQIGMGIGNGLTTNSHSGIQTGEEGSFPRIATLAILAIFAALIAILTTNRSLMLGFGTAALTLLICGALVGYVARRARFGREATIVAIADFIKNDRAPSFLTAPDGWILSSNKAAKVQFADSLDKTLQACLRTTFADPAILLLRLQGQAQGTGSACEDVVTRTGSIRVSVTQASDDGLVWRIEPLNASTSNLDDDSTTQLPMVMTGRNGSVLYMNAAARTMVGRRVKSLDRLFPNLPITPGGLMQVTTADGNITSIIAETSAGAGRKALYFLPAPKRKEAEEGWQVFEDLPVALLKIAPDGSIMSHNKSAANLIGPMLSESSHISHLMEGLGRSISDWLADTLAGRSEHKSEFLRLTRSDNETFVQVTLNRITSDGEPAMIAVLNDATELKSLEAKFVQSQKMQAIGQLAGGVAHDFNNLLTAISGHCDLLLLRHDKGDPDFGDLMQINQNANRAAALVGQLLAFSRKQTLRPETLDMRDTLADLTHLLNRLVGEKVTLSLAHDPLLKPIRADKRQLEQVLMNLVVNARDAMPNGGEIRITTNCITLEEPLTRDRATVPAGNYISLEVRDEGTGIEPDKLTKVFEPFFTTKRTGEGTGLGLSTAYGIVKQTGGFIFVDSKVGSGTAFTLYFPVFEEPLSAPEPAPTPTPRKVTKKDDGVILLVEDEAPVRAFASRALRLRGYTVIEADSAEAALETLEDDSLKIDVFVTDVVMPGMNGPSWVSKALQDRPGVRVVFVSGYAEDSFEEAQTKIPNSVFLPKPFSLSELTDTVHKQLH